MPDKEPSKLKMIIAYLTLATLIIGVGGAVWASGFRYTMKYETDDLESKMQEIHLSQNQKHAETDDKKKLSDLQLERRITQAEIRHAKGEGNQEDIVELREALKAINAEIRELKKKLGL